MDDPNADFDPVAYNNHLAGSKLANDPRFNNKDFKAGFFSTILEEPYRMLFKYLSHIDDDDERDIRIGMSIAMVGLENMLKGHITPEKWLEYRTTIPF